MAKSIFSQPAVFRPDYLYRLVFSAIFIIISLVLISCPDNPTTHHRDSTIHLEVVNEGTFSVRLKVSVEDSSDVWSFRLNRDDSTVAVISSLRADTTVRDGGLLPGHTYRYRAYWLDGGIATDSSEEVFATTLDTTSHNFAWEIDTLGNYGSYLNDVAIIDENNIWVVGYITTDTATYNAAHWNGSEWELLLIDRIVDFDGVFAFNENEIWFSDGCFIYRYDGKIFTKIWECDWETYGPGQVNKIWGSSPDDIYFVGDNGSIVHYDGSGFERLESGTEMDLLDIDGTPDGEHVFATGYNQIGTWAGYSIVLSYEDGAWTTVKEVDHFSSDWPLEWGLISSVWAQEHEAYIMTYSGIRTYDYVTGETELKYTRGIMGTTTSHIVRIRGNHINDILLVNRLGAVHHFNGVNWYIASAIEDQIDVYITGMDFKEDIFVSVGWNISLENAYIIIGRRNE